MTPREWEASADPAAMLTFALPRLTDRKLRLYLVGFCRRHWDHFPVDPHRQAVATGERYADGRAHDDERHRMAQLLSKPVQYSSPDAPDSPLTTSAWMTCLTGGELRRNGSWGSSIATTGPAGVAWWLGIQARRVGGSEAQVVSELRERAAQAALLRCVAGSPFAYALPDPRWLTAAAVGIARTAYESRDFAALPVLADALQEAGCDDPLILDHCRGGGPHARGCWVVDLLLGRE